MIEQFVRGGDAAFCQVTLTTCQNSFTVRLSSKFVIQLSSHTKCFATVTILRNIMHGTILTSSGQWFSFCTTRHYKLQRVYQIWGHDLIWAQGV